MLAQKQHKQHMEKKCNFDVHRGNWCLVITVQQNTSSETTTSVAEK